MNATDEPTEQLERLDGPQTPDVTTTSPTDLTNVEGHLFTPYGKWKYEVRLDYTGLDISDWDHWALARQALAQATANGTSGVTIADLTDYWSLVITDGPAGFPIMVKGA
jgi:hypothetical protein